MNTRSWELVATDEPTVVAKPLLDSILVEDGQSDGRLPDPPCTDESDGCGVFSEANNLLDQLVASETGPRRWGRWLPKYARCKCEVLDSLVVEAAADLVWTWATVSILQLSMG
jgi:hypothetical protein